MGITGEFSRPCSELMPGASYSSQGTLSWLILGAGPYAEVEVTRHGST